MQHILQKIDEKHYDSETKTALKLLVRSEYILDNVFVHIMNDEKFKDTDIIEIEKLACDISSYLRRKLSKQNDCFMHK